MSQMSELRGAVLGKGYRLDKHVAGRDDNEYEATHERIPGHFIIRLFPVEILTQPEASSRIQRGARVASLIRDPHAVQTLDFSVSGEVPAFVVVERSQGRTLDAVVAEDGMLPLPQAIDLVGSIAVAISAGHDIGLVHGDLRPAHVILPMSGRPLTKLSGFGWAKEMRAAARVPVPSDYLAPEQHFGKVLTLDERVDQFGLAVLAYEIIAGCLPFTAESADLAEQLGSHRTPPAIADLVSGVPRQIDEVLRRALAFTPSERFSGVRELVSELQTAATVGSRSRLAPPAHPKPLPSGATPTAKSGNDATDEMEIGTWEPNRPNDGGAHRHRAHEPTIESDHAKGDPDSDASDDAKLVLGPTSGPIRADEEKTQIRRSPFLTHEDMAAQGPHEHARSTPRRGMPFGRPGLDAESAQPIVLKPPDRLALARRNLSVDVRAHVGSLWNQAVVRRKWTLPAAMGLGTLLFVGTIVRMTGSDPTVGPSASDRTLSARRARSPIQIPPKPVARPPTAVVAPATLSTETTPAGPANLGSPAIEPSLPGDAAAPDFGKEIAVSGQTSRGPGAPVIAPIETADLSPRSAEANTPAANRQTIALSRPSPVRPVGHRANPRSATSIALRGSTPTSRLPGTSNAISTAASAPRPTPFPAVNSGDCALRITSKPWAQIWIDGKNTGQRTPVDNLRIPCGTRKLQLKRPDRAIEQMEMLQVVPGKPYQASYELQ